MDAPQKKHSGGEKEMVMKWEKGGEDIFLREVKFKHNLE